MSFLSDAVSQAEQQITTNTRGQINSIQSGITGAIANVRNTAVSGVVGAVNNTVKSALGSVVGAAGDLLTGNVSAAVSSLANAPANAFSAAISGLGGLASSGSTLSSPGTSFQSSSNNGINPGFDLVGAQSRPDPMLAYTWYAQMPVITPGSNQSTTNASSSSILANLGSSLLGGLGSSLTSALGGAIPVSNAAQLPWYYVEQATLPFRTFEAQHIFREGRPRSYPTKYSVGNLRLGIYADSSNVALTYLQAWQNAIITPFSANSAASMMGGWGRPSDYKFPIFIYLLDVTTNVLAIVEYTECWPTNVSSYSMESGNSNRIVNEVTFEVGDVFVNLVNAGSVLPGSVLRNGANNAITSTINSFASTITNAGSALLQRGAAAVTSGFASL
jgi:hypothetical protein